MPAATSARTAGVLPVAARAERPAFARAIS
jgi:hypothetical protein